MCTIFPNHICWSFRLQVASIGVLKMDIRFFNVNGPKLGINEWIHVAVTMSEDDDAAYVPSVYVNGALTDESTNWQIGEQGNESGLQTTSDDLYLGILWSQNGEDGKRNNPDPWKGGIDEFKVWKSSLSS